MRYITLIIIGIFLIAFSVSGEINGSAESFPQTDSIVNDLIPSDTDTSDSIPVDTLPTDSIQQDTEPSEIDTSGPGGVPVHAQWPHSLASRTIPLLHINTESYRPIVDKINYIAATACIEVPENQTLWEPLADVDAPVELEIRGRGNFTWFNTEKKAYKLKFKKKQSVLGMPANKHYALICYDMFYNTSGWLGPYIGMEVCRLIQPDWVPRMQPVEVILNGEYRGIYLLVESVKIAADRLDIEVQDEEENDSEVIGNGGWLVELDNQDDEFQITVPSINKTGYLRVTHKEPEVISAEQREWLTDEFTYLSQLIDYPSMYPEDTWINHFDLPSIARYMVIREFLHDIDGYSGSQYFHRTKGSDKWVAGPMWDLEIWPEPKPGWIRDFPRWSMMNWIPSMMRNPYLCHEFLVAWDDFYPSKMDTLMSILEETAEIYREADAANTLRWPEETRTVNENVAQLGMDLSFNAYWIDRHKLDLQPKVDTKKILSETAEEELMIYVYTLDGQLIYAAQKGTSENPDLLSDIKGEFRGPALLCIIGSDGKPRISRIRI